MFAFQEAGATGLGVLGLVRMLPAAVALPVGCVLTDRHARQRVLLGMYGARAPSLATAAAALAAGAPSALVFLLAGVAAVTAAPGRAATMSLVPLLARTPQELVAANIASSTLEGIGTCVGPVLGGVLAATAAVDVAVAVGAAIYVGCALLVGGVRRQGDVPARRRTERDAVEELLGGVRTLLAEPHPRLIVLLFGSQALVRGLLNVLFVVVALQLLDIGESGVGWLNAGLGAGGLVGGLAALTLVGQRRLAGPFALGLVLWGVPIALAAAWPHAAWVLLCIVVVGVGNAVLDGFWSHAHAAHRRRARPGPGLRRLRDPRHGRRGGRLRSRRAAALADRRASGARRRRGDPPHPRPARVRSPPRHRPERRATGSSSSPRGRSTSSTTARGCGRSAPATTSARSRSCTTCPAPPPASPAPTPSYSLARETFLAAVTRDLRSSTTATDVVDRRLAALRELGGAPAPR